MATLKKSEKQDTPPMALTIGDGWRLGLGLWLSFILVFGFISAVGGIFALTLFLLQ